MRKSVKMENGERDRKLFFEYRNFLFNLSNEQQISTKSSPDFLINSLYVTMFDVVRLVDLTEFTKNMINILHNIEYLKKKILYILNIK